MFVHVYKYSWLRASVVFADIARKKTWAFFIIYEKQTAKRGLTQLDKNNATFVMQALGLI
jgi:hypothetical protein